MGFLITIEDRDGKKLLGIVDPTSILVRGLHAARDFALPLLWTIEWEDNTVLGNDKMVQFREEIAIVLGVLPLRERVLIDILDIMAATVHSQPDVQLKFYGD